MTNHNLTLKVALLHLAVVPARPEENLANLLELAHQAASHGARLLVAPEMALSGYCFEDRASILPHAETLEGGRWLPEIAQLAADRKVYVAVGLAERVEPGQVLYNAAFFINDQGQILGRAHKLNSESRWACPGEQSQANIWSTPWGRVAIHICADSWNSLIIRQAALKGADLLILPANWPAAGLDPYDLWRFRALENGLWFVACNRTGREPNLDCLSATSCAFDPFGQELLREKSPESAVFYVDLPLNERGLLDNERKKQILASRTPQLHHRLYGNFNPIKDLTGFLKLPKPGLLSLQALIPPPGQNPALFWEQWSQPIPEGWLLLPNWPYSPEDINKINQLAAGRAVLAQTNGEWLFLGDLKGERATGPEGQYLIDHGPARVWLAEPSQIAQPEAAIAAAKSGADLAISYWESLTPQARLLASLRPIDQLATAIVAPDGAAMGLLWAGHQAGRGASVASGQVGGLEFDTRETREKRFQDRLDFAVFFQNPVA
ncbi:MAG: carbon-nitrogen hydrolase family protein [Deltaproteobacteria bacterium]|jgi:predicted amidohydrolase|nr:carbon-nitrogen hydrolase family protein [Deltaproteobacteria bacterium]